MTEVHLLAAVRGGDETAFGRLIDPYRRELHAHCYRMLGSVADAEDALQDALLGAWRGLPRFEGRSSVRSWLYTIATHACLRAIARRPKRVLPIDYGPSADPHDPLAEPLLESIWIEPFADAALPTPATPATRYERREAVELAFIAALQHLPARRRAVLILRDVLGFSARRDAVLAMPPEPTWFTGADAIRAFLSAFPLAPRRPGTGSCRSPPTASRPSVTTAGGRRPTHSCDTRSPS